MEITVNRIRQTANSTTGVLDIEGKLFCYTLEPGNPIPAGRYALTKYHSPVHGDVPLVNNIPGHTYVEWHPGNYPGDTRNCLLPGLNVGRGYVGSSKAACSALFPIVFAALAKGKVWVTYKDLY